MLQDLVLETIHHAYLIVGDTRVSRPLLAKWFLTHGLETSGNPNFLEIKTPTFFIEHVHQVKRFVSQKSIKGSHTFVVIVAQYFSGPAQHALLKTLEEPGDDVTIFVLVPRRHLVLPTILSRVVEMSVVGEEGEEVVSELSAKKFASSKLAERLQMVDVFLKKHQDDEEKSVMKGEVNQLLVDLEGLWNKGKKRDPQKLKDIWFVKKYLHYTGSSVKMLLDFLSVNL